MKPTITDAISILKPNVAFSIEAGVISAWDTCEIKTGETQPVQSEIDVKYAELLADYDAKQYQRDRQYPSIGEQLDLQYWDKKNGTKKWEEAIDKVKADHPKG